MANTSFYGLTGTTAAVQNTIQASVDAAATSATNSATSETNSATSAASKNAAAVSAAAALVSQNAASTSASTATTQAALATTNGAAQVTLAATQAALATTNGAAQVTLAAAQVALATTQATNSATSATASANSATAAAGSATTATTQATTATTQATAATTAKTAAETAKTGAETALDDFTDIYLGAKNTSGGNPTTDNDGDALITGALMYDQTNALMKTYSGSSWVAAFASAGGALVNSNNLADVSSVSSSRGNLGLGTAAVLNTGTSAGNAIVLDGSARLPAVDGSQLTGLPSGYSGWTVSDGSNSENIASTNTVTFAGSGATSVAYNTSNNTLTVSNSNATTSAAGLMSSTDKTKLDAVEASADVTDTTNVVASLTAGTGISIAGNGTIANTIAATTSASDLTSGTLPDARFPAALPAISGANLTNLPAGGIASLAADSSPQLAGDLDVQSNDILMGSQSVKFGTSKWEIVLDAGDNDLNFKYNGTTVFKLSSAGAVVAADNVTGYGTP